MGVVFRMFFVFALVFGATGIGIAQNNKEPREVSVNGQDFIIHYVEAGQTLYAISKIYSISVEDIQQANPEIENFGIRIGQTLRIPKKKIDKKEAKKSEIVISGDTIYHEVVKKETLYALSKKYDLSIEELDSFNPELVDGLKTGMIIKIPVKNNASSTAENQKPKQDSLKLHEIQPNETLNDVAEKFEVSADSIQMVNNGLKQGLQVGTSIRLPIENPEYTAVQDTLVDSLGNVIADLRKIDTLKVGVFLPFSVLKNKELQELNESDDTYLLTKISLEFYRGLNLAMDSLRALGYDVSINYFDTKNDTNACHDLLKQNNFSSYHLFIGPLFQSNFKIIALQAKSLHIPIISPVKVSSRLLLDNKYVVKSYASSPSQVIYTAKYMGSHYKDSNLVVISGSQQKDTRNAIIFEKYLNNAVEDSIPVYKIWQTSKGNFTKHITLGKHNYVAIISNDEAFVSSALAAYKSMVDEKTKISVFGLDSWRKFTSIDYDYYMQLNVTYPVQQFVNYSDTAVIEFVSNYRNTYAVDPSIHVFSAFDIGLYFGIALFRGHDDWINFVETNPKKGLSFRFDFLKIADKSGFENQGGFMLNYKDYELNLAD